MTQRHVIAFVAAAALHGALLHFAPSAEALQPRKPVVLSLHQLPPPRVAAAVAPQAAPKRAKRAPQAVALVEHVMQAPVTVQSPEAPALVQGDAPVAEPAVIAQVAPVEPKRSEGGQGESDAQGVDPDALDNYRGSLHARVAGMQRYPLQARRMRIQGVTTLVFRVSRDGQLVCPPRVISSSHPLLDAEAMRMVQAAAPFPPRPRGMSDSDEIRISINFALNS